METVTRSISLIQASFQHMSAGNKRRFLFFEFHILFFLDLDVLDYVLDLDSNFSQKKERKL